MRNKLIILLLLINVLALSGCTTFDHSDIPYCDEANITPAECYGLNEIDSCAFWTGYECEESRNYSQAICKRFALVGFHQGLKFCFVDARPFFNTSMFIDWSINITGNWTFVTEAFERCIDCNATKIRAEIWGEDFECMTTEEYDNLNYTVLTITREEFVSMACYRQIDWLAGGCYPSDCNMPNPPICKMIYMVYCYSPDSPESKYFSNIYINKTKILER